MREAGDCGGCGRRAARISATGLSLGCGMVAWAASQRRPKIEMRPLAHRRLMNAMTPDTERLNSQVQGTGADGLKRALALLWETRSQFPTAFPVIASHDEIVVEADETDVEAVADWPRDAMVAGMAPLIAPVPVEVEAQIGKTCGG
jgi:DNA polymerase-1